MGGVAQRGCGVVPRWGHCSVIWGLDPAHPYPEPAGPWVGLQVPRGGHGTSPHSARTQGSLPLSQVTGPADTEARQGPAQTWGGSHSAPCPALSHGHPRQTPGHARDTDLRVTAPTEGASGTWDLSASRVWWGSSTGQWVTRAALPKCQGSPSPPSVLGLPSPTRSVGAPLFAVFGRFPGWDGG